MKDHHDFINQFREINPKFSRFYACFLNHADITLSQYALLNHLVNTGTVPMTELSSKLRISKPAVTHLVDQLEKKKFLRRNPHPKDRRVHLIETLPKGKKIIGDVQTHILQFLLRTFDQFSVSEQKTIQKFYALLSQTMDKVLEEQGGK